MCCVVDSFSTATYILYNHRANNSFALLIILFVWDKLSFLLGILPKANRSNTKVATIKLGRIDRLFDLYAPIILKRGDSISRLFLRKQV